MLSLHVHSAQRQQLRAQRSLPGFEILEQLGGVRLAAVMLARFERACEGELRGVVLVAFCGVCATEEAPYGSPKP